MTYFRLYARYYILCILKVCYACQAVNYVVWIIIGYHHLKNPLKTSEVLTSEKSGWKIRRTKFTLT